MNCISVFSIFTKDIDHIERLRRIGSAIEGLRRDLGIPRDATGTSSLTLPLATPCFGEEEIAEAVLTLLEGKLTMGERTRCFERAWADYLGVDHSVMVNSGSSANLLALKAVQLLYGDRIAKGKKEVITSPITWSTSVFPIYDVGGVPHFTDVDLGGLTQKWTSASEAVSPKTFALFPIHLMGIPTDIEIWADEAEDRGIPLIEDCCESHGARRHGEFLGTYGLISTFSFFFSHQLTTIEGGMICTSDTRVADTLRSLRAHGWIRERSDRDQISAQYPHIDPRFLFVHHGYNVRPTEIQAAFGLHQLPRLEVEVGRRSRVVDSWRSFIMKEGLPIMIPHPAQGDKASWFGIPFILKPDANKSRSEVVEELASAGVDSRPIMAGNFTEQPAAKRHGFLQTGQLRNAETVARLGFYLGIPSRLTAETTTAAQSIMKRALSV